MTDGVRVTCENGHYIATYTEEVVAGGVLNADAFTKYAHGVDHFVGGDLIRERCCPKCDGLVFWVKSYRGPARMHTEDGWKP